MSPRRHFSVGGISTPSEEPEQAVSAELGELRALVTHLVARSFRQDQRLEQLLAQRGDLAVDEGAGASEQRPDKKRPAPDNDGQASSGKPPRPLRPQSTGRGRLDRRGPGRSQRPPQQQSRQSRASVRCIFCRGQHSSNTCGLREGRCFRCGQPGHIRPTCPFRVLVAPSSALAPTASQQRSQRPQRHRQQQQQVRQPQSTVRCIFCEGQHTSGACDLRFGRCFKCGQPGHMRVTCPSEITVAPTSAFVPTTSQLRPGASPTDLQGDQVSFPRPSGERQPLSSSQDDLALAEDSTIADREEAGMIYFLA